jgi:hypothetical protein
MVAEARLGIIRAAKIAHIEAEVVVEVTAGVAGKLIFWAHADSLTLYLSSCHGDLLRGLYFESHTALAITLSLTLPTQLAKDTSPECCYLPATHSQRFRLNSSFHKDSLQLIQINPGLATLLNSLNHL